MPGLTWDHTENIALALHEKFPDLDPTHIRYTDLHQWITELADFKDDPEGVDRRQAGSDPDGVAGRVSGQPGIAGSRRPVGLVLDWLSRSITQENFNAEAEDT